MRPSRIWPATHPRSPRTIEPWLIRTALYRRSRQSRPRFRLSRHRNLAKPVSRLRNPHRRPGADLRLPQDRPARLRPAHHPLHAPPALPRAEIAQRVSLLLPQPGHLPGKHRQPGAGRRGQGLRPGLGRSPRRVPPPRRHRHHRRGPLAKTTCGGADAFSWNAPGVRRGMQCFVIF